jgi:hypothetical protein
LVAGSFFTGLGDLYAEYQPVADISKAKIPWILGTKIDFIIVLWEFCNYFTELCNNHMANSRHFCDVIIKS